MVQIIVLVAALVLFLVRSFGVGGPVHLGWVGMAVFMLYFLVPGLSDA